MGDLLAVQAVNLEVDRELVTRAAAKIAVPTVRDQAALGEKLENPGHDGRLSHCLNGEARRGAGSFCPKTLN